MNKKQAEDLRVRVVERRNYLREMEAPLRYTKGNLYGGMQNRVQRKEDRAFNQRVAKQRSVVNNKIKDIDTYLVNLSKYNAQQVAYNAQQPNGAVGTFGAASSNEAQAPVLKAPVLKEVAMPKLPKRVISRSSIGRGRY